MDDQLHNPPKLCVSGNFLQKIGSLPQAMAYAIILRDTLSYIALTRSDWSSLSMVAFHLRTVEESSN